MNEYWMNIESLINTILNVLLLEKLRNIKGITFEMQLQDSVIWDSVFYILILY
jgi:hypothetical protein